MKKMVMGTLLILLTQLTRAQDEKEAQVEQQLENQAEKDDAEGEDDALQQMWEHLRRHRLNLNVADEDDLKTLGVLTDIQIVNFITYRHILGELVSIYELQAVPAWDLNTIRTLLPLITVARIQPVSKLLRDRLTKGEHSILLRYAQVVEQADGYKTLDSGIVNHYIGSPGKLFCRYKYNFDNLLQFGALGEKDAGEQLFKDTQKRGFDFYSFHFFARNVGKFQAIAVGDYTVNFGQGLIQWQGLAFKKNSMVTAIKRQAPALRPYNSSGEFNFHRGAAVTIRQKNFSYTLFASYRKFSGNIVSDSVTHQQFVSSLQASGYHRTASEIADRNTVAAFIAGGSFQYKSKLYHAGINAVQYYFSTPFQKKDEPYNLYGLAGNRLGNFSVDYSYTYRNVHVFGEVAADHHGRLALLNGLLASLDNKIDVAVLHRHISKQYQSLFSNAFTENTMPGNETGLYAGLQVRPAYSLQFDAYMDIYHFPWLKFRSAAPGGGHDYMLQLTYQPNKTTQMYTRYRTESKTTDVDTDDEPMDKVAAVPSSQWRLHLNQSITKRLSVKTRVEVVWRRDHSEAKENGYLWFGDISYKASMRFFTNFRLQYFETGSYDTRIYAYENDVLYSSSIPAFFDKGIRAYANVRLAMTNWFRLERANIDKAQLWLRIARNFYPARNSIGSGLDTIEGKGRTEVKIQMIVTM